MKAKTTYENPRAGIDSPIPKSDTNVKQAALICGYYVPGYPRYASTKTALADMFEIRDMAKDVVSTSIVSRVKEATSVSREARRQKCSIIHVYPGNYLLTILLGALKPYHKSKVVFDIYQSASLVVRSHTKSRLQIFKMDSLEYLAAHAADILLCLSPEYRDYYHRKVRVQLNKLRIVMDGVNPSWVNQPKKAKQSDGITRVIYWGNYLPHHDLPLVVDVARALQRRHDIRFVFCGTGDSKEDVRELAKDLDNVEFKGKLPLDELIDTVDSADIVLGHLKNISDTELSAANKQIEGMARGKPVIAAWSKQKENLYMTESKPQPLILLRNPVAELANTIVDLADHPETAIQIGKKAKLIADEIHSQTKVNSAVREAFNDRVLKQNSTLYDQSSKEG